MSTVAEPTIDLHSHWTVEMVQRMPRVEGERYEIIGGELLVTTQPNTRHQMVCDNIIIELGIWGRQTKLGRTIQAPGLIYADDDAVAPDLVWVSKERLKAILLPDGKLHDSPELVVEILSPGKGNAERDREKKLALYNRRGVPEYWIVDWQAETVDVYRRVDDTLTLVQSLTQTDEIASPLLPGFACPIRQFFEL